jgi:hypothetical protein
MDRLFNMFAPMRGKAHIVLMGVGGDTHTSSGASSQSEQCGYAGEQMMEERAHLAGLVLLFQKRNFPLVSVNHMKFIMLLYFQSMACSCIITNTTFMT